MTNTTHSFSFTLYPLEWGSDVLSSKVVLYGYGLITTGYSFLATATVTTAGGKPLPSISLGNTSGFTSVYLGEIAIPTPSKTDTVYPLTIGGSITCSTPFAMVPSPQIAVGLKPSGIPVSYVAGVFCNDSGSDNDWNDLVLNFQLFSQTTD